MPGWACRPDGHVCNARGDARREPITRSRFAWRQPLQTLTTLSRDRIYDDLTGVGQQLMDGLQSLLGSAGMEARLQGLPQIFHVGFGVSDPITNYRESRKADKQRYVQFATALLEEGVRVLERGAWFLSTAHSASIIDETLDAVQSAVKKNLSNASAGPCRTCYWRSSWNWQCRCARFLRQKGQTSP